jgi:FKBP-type peptidyl-prolyl cis-trans isomerase
VKLALAAVLLACACGRAAPAPRPVTLPKARGHEPSLAERRAALCARRDLVPLGAPVVAAAARPTEAGTVRDVSVRDAQGRAAEVRAEVLAPLAPGVMLDEAAAREVERRLWKTGRFDDVALETSRADGGGVHVVFRVEPKRELADVFVAGDADQGDTQALRLLSHAIYDPVALVGARRSLVAAYRAKGYLDAAVSVSSTFAGADRRTVDACVRVDRGPRVTLDAVRVHGSAFDAQLEAMLAREDTENVHGAVLAEDVLERDLLLVAAFLYDRGLLENKVEKKIERRGDTVSVSIDVVDGAVFRYGAIDVKGHLAAPKAEYTKLVTEKRGAVFNRTRMMKIVDAVRALQTSKGRPDDDVEPETNLDDKKHTVSIVISIKGPQGFSIVELARGKGRAAKRGDLVSVRYTGKLASGKVFDTNVSKAPFSFKLGGGSVIAGFDRGVSGMKIGEKRRVTIPPDLGYGSRAIGGIPPSSVLVFDIELVSIQ